MAELFRYIEQSFIVPAATPSIDVGRESDLQNTLRSAVAQHLPPEGIRSIADTFILKSFSSPAADPFHFAAQYLSFAAQLLALPSGTKVVAQLISAVFGTDAVALIASTTFLSDKAVLDDALVSVKLVTAFDRVNATDLVAMRQTIAFVEDFAAGRVTDFTPEGLRAVLRRPIKIPKTFIDALAPGTDRPAGRSTSNPQPDPAVGLRTALLAEQQNLKTAYDTVMGLQPEQYQLISLTMDEHLLSTEGGRPASPDSKGGGRGAKLARAAAAAIVPEIDTSTSPTIPKFAAIPQTVVKRFGADVRKTLETANIDLSAAPPAHVVTAIKRRWQQVSGELAPYQVPGPAKVFRVGAHLFAVQQAPITTVKDAPNFAGGFSSQVKIRPVGIGNLQVVRQELIGYEARDISHIENVLEGELLRRFTRREEMNELTTTQETDTIQAEERDQQSTTRNELSSEAQKESGHQSSSAKDQTSTSEYGKLVENSKTNYARSVTDRAVNTLTQMVKLQRVQRERKTYTEEAVHELDNKTGQKKVRGVYQWVDKKYKARILNYGKRLLFDVVVPEPAAFLIDSLKHALQPENFELTKPRNPNISPTDLDPSNYLYYANQYGVTGSVSPAPEEFIKTVAKPDTQDAKESMPIFWTTSNPDGTRSIHNGTLPRNFFAAYNIVIPENYKAVSGFIQQVLWRSLAPAPNKYVEFFVGDRYHYIFGPSFTPTINKFFTMNGETGDIPVTMRCYDNVIQFAYAIGINCQRTEKAYEQWQLKTHAVIMAGYQRQVADYQDKLNQYRSAVRAQMAVAQNFAHDPSVEQEELKKAFIFLLLGEHFFEVYRQTPDPEGFPPDVAGVAEWGAMVAFFERAFEWENIMYTFYPYFWGRPSQWGELILIQDTDPQFAAFLKAGAARVVVPARPGFEAALAHYRETGDVWMGEEMPDMFSDLYVSIIDEIKSRNFAPGKEICVAEWDVRLPTTLVMLKDDGVLPEWKPTVECSPPADQ